METLKLLPTPEAKNHEGYQVVRGKKIPRLGAVVTSSLGDFPASHSRQQDLERELRITATSGRKCLELYLLSNRRGSSLKMFVDSLLGMTAWYSSKCALIWKVKATKSNRLLFQLSPLMHLTGETEFGLLRTPDTGMDRGSRTKENLKDRYLVRKMPLNLNDQIAMHEKGLLPTPQASDPTTGSVVGKNDLFYQTKTGMPRKVNQKGTDGSVGLPRLIMMLPTPTSRDYRSGKGKSQVERGRNNRAPLSEIGKETGLKLQPNFVEWMMGYPRNWTDLSSPKQVTGSKGSKRSAMRSSHR